MIIDYLKQHDWHHRYTYLTNTGEVYSIWTIMPLPGEAWDYEKKVGDIWYNIKYADTTGKTMIIKRYVTSATIRLTNSPFGVIIDESKYVNEPNTTILKEDILFDGVIKTVDELTTILKTLDIS